MSSIFLSNTDLSKRLKQIKYCYLSDRHFLAKTLQQIKHDKNHDRQQHKLLAWDKRLDKSLTKVRKRQQFLTEKKPQIRFPDELPVSHKITEIKQLFLKHQVIIIAGHTGSGKTTQLPKMCLQAGRGIFAKIAHTQPRRIAARSVADRIAQELETELGEMVGYKIRFQDHSQDSSYLKLMTDGILLAETQTDRFLNQYDTIIIDEAHERSLNIDFLLGYLKKLLVKRHDLKIIITSATINTQRFSNFFNQAPVLEVSGKTFPVDILYRTYEPQNIENIQTSHSADKLENKNNLAINHKIVLAADELLNIDQSGDILVFLSGEKEIREAHTELKNSTLKSIQRVEIIPLYARLSQAEQSRIFKAHNKRRIILATNIAETSLTVPGIRYVIDTGMAKISRYSVHSKIQRLAVEKISQASAKQRSGRCGRLSAGIAIRLYDEVDFQLRSEFTQPEILRTNLAQVILQMWVLKLGKIEDFPFIEPPEQKQINDGLLLLKQLGAVNSHTNGSLSISAMGLKIAKLSIEPRLARVVIEANQQGVLAEILVIVAALSSLDPRERPNNARQQADEKHLRYSDKNSDFISFLNLWCQIHEQRQQLSQNKFRKYCYENFLSFMRIREWQEIRSQLRTQLREIGIKDIALNCQQLKTVDVDYRGIHLALLSGLTGFVAMHNEESKEQQKNQQKNKPSYLACRNLSLAIHPGSGLQKRAKKNSPKWIIAAEVVETHQVYARVVASIEPIWIEEQAQHLIKHHYYDPQWDNKKGIVLAKDKMTLYGLVINHGKKVPYGAIDPELANEIFIKEALVTGRYRGFHGKQPAFIKHNTTLIKDIESLEHKSRRQDILVDDLKIYDFYQSRIKAAIYSRGEFEKWANHAFKKNKTVLFMHEDDLKQHGAEHITDELYPPMLLINDMRIPLEYHFMPSHPLDGVTAIFPLDIINQLQSKHFQWLVPGLIREKITYIFRSLPKVLRRHLVPIPDKITEFLESAYSSKKADLNASILSFLEQQLTQQFGLHLSKHVNLESLATIEFPIHLQMNYRIIDNKNQELESSRNLFDLQQKWAKKAQHNLASSNKKKHSIERQGLLNWDFEELPKQLEAQQSGIKMRLYPALCDVTQAGKSSVSIVLYDTHLKAQHAMYHGLFRLFYLQLEKPLSQLLKQKYYQEKLQKLCLLYLSFGKCQQLQQQIISRVVKESCSPENLLYHRDDFEKKCQSALQHIELLLDEQLNAIQVALSSYLQINKIIKKNVPINLIHSYQQIKDQLRYLYAPEFISNTPLPWLKRFPRYLKAIEIRLHKAANDARKDQLLNSQYENLFNQLLAYLPPKQEQLSFISMNQSLLEFIWLLEELKISLFAQELKTIQSVSIKRLNKKWQEIKCNLSK